MQLVGARVWLKAFSFSFFQMNYNAVSLAKVWNAAFLKKWFWLVDGKSFLI
jgi:hypothetical protein